MNHTNSARARHPRVYRPGRSVGDGLMISNSGALSCFLPRAGYCGEIRTTGLAAFLFQGSPLDASRHGDAVTGAVFAMPPLPVTALIF